MPTLRVWFTLICMVEYIVVALLAELRHHKFHTEGIL